MGIAVAATALMGAQAGLSYIQQSKEASYQEKYQKAQNQQAYKSAREQYSQLSYQETDAQRDNLEDGIDAQVQSLQAESKVNLMAAASGTGGLSVDDMLQDVSRQKGENMTTVAQNRATDAYNVRQQAASIKYGTKIDTRKINKPSLLGSAVSGAAQGVQTYASMSGGA